MNMHIFYLEIGPPVDDLGSNGLSTS